MLGDDRQFSISPFPFSTPCFWVALAGGDDVLVSDEQKAWNTNGMI
jgi:hypothetical protein